MINIDIRISFKEFLKYYRLNPEAFNLLDECVVYRAGNTEVFGIGFDFWNSIIYKLFYTNIQTYNRNTEKNKRKIEFYDAVSTDLISIQK